MTWAIPEYRLPRGPLLAEIENIRRAGVDIRCNQALGRDFTLDELLGTRGYNAVILAIGAHRSRQLGIPGEDKHGVIHGIDFLSRVAGDSTLRAAGCRPRRRCRTCAASASRSSAAATWRSTWPGRRCGWAHARST